MKGLGHYNECLAYPLTCPNECGASDIKRKDMADHRSVCSQEPVECPFAEAGCDGNLRRHQFDEHLTSNQQKHLLLMMGAYKEVKSNLQSTEAKLKETEAKLTTAVQLLSQGTREDKEIMHSIIAYSPCLTKYNDNLTITMPQVSKYHHSGNIWYSPQFYYKEGYKMCLAVSGVEVESEVCTGLTVCVQLLEGERDDQLEWPIGHEGHCRPPLPSYAGYRFFRVCGLNQLQTKSGQYLCSSILVSDCLTFNVMHFYNNCDLKVEIKNTNWCT